MYCRVAEDAGGFSKWYAPESIVVLVPLENARFHSFYSYIIVVRHQGTFVVFTENGNIANIHECSNTE